ncbi:hypothetical protein NL529_30915, partial [Klebsiella pneumoniae]|nr:hypothetical protein [Klebsiella pneumoniae]
INGLCAFESGGEQLVATNHADRTVRVSRSAQVDASEDSSSDAFELVECCRFKVDDPNESPKSPLPLFPSKPLKLGQHLSHYQCTT